MYVKFFDDKEGRMTEAMFELICMAHEYDHTKVLKQANNLGYSFDNNFYCDLESLVKLEEVKRK